MMIGCTVNAFWEDPFGFGGIRKDLLECSGVLFSSFLFMEGALVFLYIITLSKEGFIGLFVSILYTISEKCQDIIIDF